MRSGQKRRSKLMKGIIFIKHFSCGFLRGGTTWEKYDLAGDNIKIDPKGNGYENERLNVPNIK